MTFCVAMKVKDGLVALADTRITSGTRVYRGEKRFDLSMASGLPNDLSLIWTSFYTTSCRKDF
jgi:predicted proteasome-type protease